MGGRQPAALVALAIACTNCLLLAAVFSVLPITTACPHHSFEAISAQEAVSQFGATPAEQSRSAATSIGARRLLSSSDGVTFVRVPQPILADDVDRRQLLEAGKKSTKKHTTHAAAVAAAAARRAAKRKPTKARKHKSRTKKKTLKPLKATKTVLRKRGCGYADSGNATEIQARLQPHLDILDTVAGQRAAAGQPNYINVHVHMIGRNDRSGVASQSVMRKQIAVLNSAYQASNFVFNLVFSELVYNSAWNPLPFPGSTYLAMKRALHRGGPADLNIYITQMNAGGTIGSSTNPWGYGTGVIALDGVLIDARTLPGGAFGGVNMGMNAVHEVGHWMGLNHPFVGGCSERNDDIDDTAQQKAGNFNCYPRGSALPNSCPNKPKNQPKNDPVNNYMGYTYDACMWEFTRGQMKRMTASWQAYRRSSYKKLAWLSPSANVPVRNFAG